MIKILIVDDHALVRLGISEILAGIDDFTVVGEAGTGWEGLELARRLYPDVIILDLKLPDQPGLEVAQKLLGFNPHFKVLVLSAVTDDFSVFCLLEAGVHGYLSKEANPEELIQAVRAVDAGQRVLSPELAKRFELAKADHKKENMFAEISEREREVLRMIIRGITVKEMAETLHISHKTIHSYRNRLFEKLNVKTDLALTLLALHHNLIYTE